jgi:ubiquinone/menaquinone biosynthesis C-methylase UbiE
LQTIQNNGEITIVDVGCGNGDMLRLLPIMVYSIILISDANNFTVKHAINLSKDVSKYHNVIEDIFDKLLNCMILFCAP